MWDIERDARNRPGGCPVVAHPPCRAWGRLRTFAKPREGERELALWAVEKVRKWGGVLEHPASSLLWPEANLPAPGKRDDFGGWSLLSLWLVREASRLALLRSAFSLLLGRLRLAPVIEASSMESLTVNSRRRRLRRLRVAVDGEVTKLRPPLRYRIRPQALNVCVPTL